MAVFPSFGCHSVGLRSLAAAGQEPYSPYLLVFLTPMFGMLTVACPRLGAPTTMVTGHLANLGTVLAKCWFRHMNQELKDKALAARISFSVVWLCFDPLHLRLLGAFGA